MYCCGDRAAPTALVASYEWDHCIDLVTIRDFDRITTARVPKRGTVDIFAPEVVVWAYQGPPQHALRALLDLVHPAHAFREGIGWLLMRRTLTERGSNPAASTTPMTRADATLHLSTRTLTWLADHPRARRLVRAMVGPAAAP